MTDEQLRALVRTAIARHLGGRAGGQVVNRAHDAPPVPLLPVGPAPFVHDSRDSRPDPPWRAHASFGRFLVMRGDEDGGACLIEPAVSCNHCGFCQSYGH